MGDLTRALLVVGGGMLTFIIVVLSVGIALDMFTFEFMGLCSDINPELAGMLGYMQNLTIMFYFMFYIAIILLGVYLAKWVFRKHHYKREEEEYYVEEL